MCKCVQALKIVLVTIMVLVSSVVKAEGYKSFNADLTCVANEHWGTSNHLIKVEFDLDALVMRETDKLVCFDEARKYYKNSGYNVILEGAKHDAYDRCVLTEIDTFLTQFPSGKEFVTPRYAPIKILSDHSMYLRVKRESVGGLDSTVQHISKNYTNDLTYWSWLSPSLDDLYYTDLDYEVPCKRQ